jgi:hypothetical protein
VSGRLLAGVSRGLLLPALALAVAGAVAQQPAAPGSVRILSAQSGLFGDPGGDLESFVAGTRLPLRDGQVFGWRMQVQTDKPRVTVREELTLPSEPATWGDPEPDVKRRTTADGRTAVSEYQLEPRAGFIANSWSVTSGDPKGTWVIKVKVEGHPERVFRFEAQ